MQGLWLTLGYGLIALLFASVLVALVEWLRQAPQPLPPLPPTPSPARLDVNLDALPEPSPAPPPLTILVPPLAAAPDFAPVPDSEARREVLAATLQRAARSTTGQPWDETEPMVLHATDAPPAAR